MRYNMRFARERGIRRETPKQDCLDLAPEARLETFYEGHMRTFLVRLGDRILARGIGAQAAWRRAAEVLKREKM